MEEGKKVADEGGQRKTKEFFFFTEKERGEIDDERAHNKPEALIPSLFMTGQATGARIIQLYSLIFPCFFHSLLLRRNITFKKFSCVLWLISAISNLQYDSWQ